MVRILLADDHDIVRLGLRDLIAHHPGWEVCGEARDGREVVALAAALRPDVAIIDTALPGPEGAALTKGVRAASPSTEVLVFTTHDSEALVAAVLAAGGRGCLLKSAPARLVVAAIEAVAAHRPYFPTDTADAQRELYLRALAGGAAPNLLTGRERDVVRLLAEGQDRNAIAARLGVAARTVKAHQEAAMLKTGARSVADLVRYAIRNGIVEA